MSVTGSRSGLRETGIAFFNGILRGKAIYFPSGVENPMLGTVKWGFNQCSFMVKFSGLLKVRASVIRSKADAYGLRE